MILKATKPRNTTYKFAVALALATAFVLVWISLAVGIIGEPDNQANLMFVGVLAIGAIGALVARFEAKGMALTMYVMTLAQGLVATIIFAAGMHTDSNTPAVAVLGLNGFFVILWAVSAWLFRYAARKEH